MNRRSFLRTTGLTGLGIAGGLAILPAPPEGEGLDRQVANADPPAAVDDWIGSPLETEAESPIARYQYRQDGNEYVPTAPINVVGLPAEEEGGLERTMAVFDDTGWVFSPEEYTRYAWDRERERYVRQGATAAETYYGTSGRLHIRCWFFEGVVSMQAHEDTGARPKHGIASYERGRTAVEALYDAAGWSISPKAVDLANERDPDHDGHATIITEAP